MRTKVSISLTKIALINEVRKVVYRQNISMVREMPTIEQIYSRPSIHFSACHFLIGYSKCDRLHGHNYSVKLRIEYDPDIVDQYFDFRVINKILSQIIGKLDHKVLIPGNSSMVKIQSIINGENLDVIFEDKKYTFPKKDVVILEDYAQTSCENIAEFLHTQLINKIEKANENVKLSRLTLILGENVGNEVSYSAKID